MSQTTQIANYKTTIIKLKNKKQIAQYSVN